ncbi:MAG: tetratricopeptide repeat protein [Runella sp.]
MRLSFFLVFVFWFQIARTQILYDATTQALVLQAIDYIYNYDFDEVEPLAKQIRAKYPNHPVNPMLKAVQMQWQYLPVKDNKSVVNQYLKLLEESIEKAKVLEKDPKTRPEAAFFSMAGHGYIALVHNYNDDRLRAATEGKKAYNYVMDGFKFMETNPEFYFSSGLYNYYVIRYPEDHPVVKPLTVFFKNGNKAEGLKQMDLAAKRGVFTRTESAFFLARILLKHEQRYPQALAYLQTLVQKYPQNPVYLMKYTEALLLNQKYAEAEDEIAKLKKRTDKFFPIAWLTFEGIYQEKYRKNDVEATKFYEAALRLRPDDEYTKEYHAFSYAGLARIALREGNRRKATAYYRKAESIGEYKAISKEVKSFFKD